MTIKFYYFEGSDKTTKERGMGVCSSKAPLERTLAEIQKEMPNITIDSIKEIPEEDFNTFIILRSLLI